MGLQPNLLHYLEFQRLRRLGNTRDFTFHSMRRFATRPVLAMLVTDWPHGKAGPLCRNSVNIDVVEVFGRGERI
jgi:hypothetical protein